MWRYIHLLCQICLPFIPLQGQTYQQLILALKGSNHSRWPELLGSRYMLLEIHKQMKLLYSRKLRHSYWLAMAKVSADVLAWVKPGYVAKKDSCWCCFEVVQSATYHRGIYWECQTCSPAGCTLEGITWRHSAPYRCPYAWLGARRILFEAHDCARGNHVCPSCCLGDDAMWVRIWL